MSNILFDEEQQKQLRSNHWVKSVTEKSISFTEDFKVYFINEYNLGKLPKQIFKNNSDNEKYRKEYICAILNYK